MHKTQFHSRFPVWHRSRLSAAVQDSLEALGQVPRGKRHLQPPILRRVELLLQPPVTAMAFL
jgi:hypothetical protein